MADIKQITDQDFSAEVLDAEGVVLVDFWAPWCGPCRMVAPVVEEIAGELGNKLKVAKVNVDQSQQVASSYGIMSIPTLMLFKNGQAVETMIGFQPKDNLLAKINPHL